MGREAFLKTALSSERVGIPSQAILNFLKRIDTERINMHGFLLVRHNTIVAEGYWAPWSVARKHRGSVYYGYSLGGTANLFCF